MPGKLFGMVSTNSLSMVKTETLSIWRQVFWRTCKSQASSVAELVLQFALDVFTRTAVSSGTSKRWFPGGLTPYSSICSCLKRYNHWMTLPFFHWSIQIVSLCRFAVMEQEMELAPQPFTCLDAKKVSPPLPCSPLTYTERTGTSYLWNLATSLGRSLGVGQKVPWLLRGHNSTHRGSVRYGSFPQNKLTVPCVRWWRRWTVAAAVAAGQKELGNGLGRRERSGNGVEEEEETSSGMCVGELGGVCLALLWVFCKLLRTSEQDWGPAYLDTLMILGRKWLSSKRYQDSRRIQCKWWIWSVGRRRTLAEGFCSAWPEEQESVRQQSQSRDVQVSCLADTEWSAGSVHCFTIHFLKQNTWSMARLDTVLLIQTVLYWSSSRGRLLAQHCLKHKLYLSSVRGKVQLLLWQLLSWVNCLQLQE